MATRTALRKKVSYRDQSGASQAAHAAHWKGYSWMSGPKIVAYVGRWGTIQVWAASHEEARAVILHACAIAAIPTDGAGAGEWIETETTDPRYGRVARVQVLEIAGYPVVTKRPGPSGAAEI